MDGLSTRWLDQGGGLKEDAPFLFELARDARGGSVWASSSEPACATGTLLTGQHPDRHGLLYGLETFKRLRRAGHQVELPHLEHGGTLPELFAKRGYRTLAVVDSPDLAQDVGLEECFDQFRGFSYAGAEAVEMAVRLIEHDWQRSPFLLYLHLHDLFSPHHHREPWSSGKSSDGDAAMRSELAYLNHHLQIVLEHVDPDDRAIVVLTGSCAEADADDAEDPLAPHLTRVPLWIRLPSKIADADWPPAGHVDLLPTLCALLGIQDTVERDGIDLLGTGDLERELFQQRWLGTGNVHGVIAENSHWIYDEEKELSLLFELDGEERIDRRALYPERHEELLRRWLRYKDRGEKP